MNEAERFSEPVVTRHDGQPPTYTLEWSHRGVRRETVMADELVEEWVADMNEMERLRKLAGRLTGMCASLRTLYEQATCLHPDDEVRILALGQSEALIMEACHKLWPSTVSDLEALS